MHRFFYVMDAYEGGLPSATYLGTLADDATDQEGADEAYPVAARPAE